MASSHTQLLSFPQVLSSCSSVHAAPAVPPPLPHSHFQGTGQGPAAMQSRHGLLLAPAALQFPGAQGAPSFTYLV